MQKKIIFMAFAIILLTVSIILNKKTPQPLESKKASEFITTSGPGLLLKNQNFHSIGVNYYDLAYKNNDLIARTFAHLREAGVTTVRFWLFSDGDPNGLQSNRETYNESGFKQADYVLYQARKNNIKLIPVLMNNWPDYGGKNQYIRWIGKNPEKDEKAFYTDPKIKSIFKNYIKYVLERKNTYTRVLYMDDPTILAWDIMNEPRGTDQTAMNNWLESMAIFIKQHDKNHLVFAGTEVAYTPAVTETKSSALCKRDIIDICSLHLYLYHENELLFKNYDEVAAFMQDQKNYAEKVNKPLILEEFGIPRDKKPFGKDSLTIIEQIIDDVKQNDFAGYLIWDWADRAKSQFTFTPDGYALDSYSLSDLKKILQ